MNLMIAISRAMARQFLAAAKKCVNGRARAPDPDVVIRQVKGKVSFTVHYSEVILQLTSPSQSDEENFLVAPMSVLDVVQEAKGDPVELHCKEKLKGEVRWVDKGQPLSKPIMLIEPQKKHDPSTQPKEIISVSEGFLKGLHECGRCASRTGGRYALDRIQVRGKQGQIIGTDGKQALIRGGFGFCFGEELLLPAIPLFGLTDLQSQDVRVGRTAIHLVVSVGPWTVWLAIQTAVRFPDVASLVPRQSPTLVRFDPQDVAAHLTEIAGLPGAGEEDHPVTLELNETVTIRGQDSKSKETRAIHFRLSRVEGPSVCLALNSRFLARALFLGCLTLRITPEKPWIAECEGMTFLGVALDPDLIVQTPMKATVSSSTTQTTPPIPLPQRRTEVKQPEPNGHSSNGRPESTPTTDTADPLVVAEELRAALAEANLKASRLVALLKSGRKEKRVLANVFAGLKQLNLE